MRWQVVIIVLLLLGGCVEQGGGAGTTDISTLSNRRNPALFNVSPYLTRTPYYTSLRDCVDITQISESCTLQRLPLLGMQGVPTKAQVLERTLVSHAWMGRRLDELLDIMPDEVFALMRPVTAVVIGSEIRPSYYSRASGAIFLDPALLWRTEQERATVSTDADYRREFGSALRSVVLSRYVRDNQYALTSSENGSRTLEQVELRFARTFLHELAHANDVLPPSARLSAREQPELSVATLIARASDQWLSTRLSAEYPLTSGVLKDLAAVRYGGVQASFSQQVFDAKELGRQMALDGASDDYAYFTNQEDVAMLFEETMMAYLYGLQRDIAYADRPASADAVCSEYLVGWGRRNRIAEALVRPRAHFVAANILPLNADWDRFFTYGLALPQQLPEGRDWCSSVDLRIATQSLATPRSANPIAYSGKIVLNPTPH